jgi:mono/diheme cytochrome c family protein
MRRLRSTLRLLSTALPSFTSRKGQPSTAMHSNAKPSTAKIAVAFGATAMLLAGCHTDMWVQPKTQPGQQSDFFVDGMMSRPLVPGTVPRGHVRLDEGFFTGQQNGEWLRELPVEVNMELLKRGQERFDIYCSPCHGRLGDGEGMIAKRGLELRRPPGNYHTDRLREMPDGHFYDVITNGYGAMYSYASRVQPQDRWAIVAYIRALQLSQNADAAQAADAQRLTPAPVTNSPEASSR